LNVKATSAAENGLPSLHVTFGRVLTTSVRFLFVHLYEVPRTYVNLLVPGLK
jgi:hypothetical protein